MKKYFLTYGDSSYKYSKIHLSYLAKQSGLFDEIISLGPNDLSNEFKKNFQEILNQKRGGGFWIWKHEIISNLLNKIKPQDIILYCDAGSSINNSAKAKKRFEEYFDIILTGDNSFLRFEAEKKYLEKFYTTKEVFENLEVPENSKIRQTTQLQAGVMFFKKNKTSEFFFNDYKNLLKKDVNLITDYYKNSQIADFKDCRHDQSIFSVLGKQYDSLILDNETEFKFRTNDQFNFPILTVRAANHGIKDKIKLTIFKKHYAKKTKFF